MVSFLLLVWGVFCVCTDFVFSAMGDRIGEMNFEVGFLGCQGIGGGNFEDSALISNIRI